MHDGDLLGAVSGTLVLACGVAQVLVVESNDRGSVDVGDSGATSDAGELSDLGLFVVCNEHVLLVSEADSSITSGLTVSLTDLLGAVDLVDSHSDVVSLAHAFDNKVVGEELGESGGESPRSSVVAVDGDSGAHVLDKNGVSVEVVFVQNLVSVFVPS